MKMEVSGFRNVSPTGVESESILGNIMDRVYARYCKIPGLASNVNAFYVRLPKPKQDFAV